MSSPKMVFSRASCPAFNITTNGETGIRQFVQGILLVAAYQAIPSEHPGRSRFVRVGELRFSPVSSHFETPPPTFPAGNGASKLACQAREAVTVSRLLNGIRSGSSVDSFVTASYLLLPKCLQPKSKVAAYRGRFFASRERNLADSPGSHRSMDQNVFRFRRSCFRRPLLPPPQRCYSAGALLNNLIPGS